MVKSRGGHWEQFTLAPHAALLQGLSEASQVYMWPDKVGIKLSVKADIPSTYIYNCPFSRYVRISHLVTINSSGQ